MIARRTRDRCLAVWIAELHTRDVSWSSYICAAPSVALAAGLLSLAACGGNSVVDPGGVAGATTSSTGMGGGGGYASMSCQELEAEYLKEFEKARLCFPEASAERRRLRRTRLNRFVSETDE